MNQKEKLEMVNRAIKGDESAFEILAEDIKDDITHICIYILGNRHDGEDAAQDSLLRIQQGMGSLKDPGQFTSWCNRIVNRSCKAVIMNREISFSENNMDQYPISPFNNLDEPARITEKAELRMLVRQEIKKLPTHYHEAIYMFYFEDLSLKKIAAVMGISSRQVIAILFRARKALQLNLENQLGKDFVPGILIPFSIQGCILFSYMVTPRKLVRAFLEAIGRFIACAGLLCKDITRIFHQIFQGFPRTAQGLEAVLMAGLALGVWQMERHTELPGMYAAEPKQEIAVSTPADSHWALPAPVNEQVAAPIIHQELAVYAALNALPSGNITDAFADDIPVLSNDGPDEEQIAYVEEDPGTIPSELEPKKEPDDLAPFLPPNTYEPEESEDDSIIVQEMNSYLYILSDDLMYKFENEIRGSSVIYSGRRDVTINYSGTTESNTASQEEHAEQSAPNAVLTREPEEDEAVALSTITQAEACLPDTWRVTSQPQDIFGESEVLPYIVLSTDPLLVGEVFAQKEE